MNPWKQALHEGAIAGSLGSLLSTAALALAGRREQGHAAQPLNAVSHWVWDRPALHATQPDVRHTLLGTAIHHGAAVLWGVLHARAWGHRSENRRWVPALAGAAVAAGAAAFVDLKLTPERLSPGFDRQLSGRALLGAYACFAVGLAAATLALRQRDAARER